MPRHHVPQKHSPIDKSYDDSTAKASHIHIKKPIHNPYHHYPSTNVYKNQERNSFHKEYRKSQITTIDIGYSDDTTDTQSYDHFYQPSSFRRSQLRESRATNLTFSDDSGSTKLPYFEFDDESTRRYSRHSLPSSSFKRFETLPNQSAQKSLRKVYPNQLYQEIATPTDISNFSRRLTNRDQPSSPTNSSVTGTVIHGCGGKCQTFENVCYFFLQLIFTMGILIGVSLYIAGIVLRKSAARNLQVLMYIGILLSLVSGLLLGIQYDARKGARKRKKALQLAKKAPIPLEILPLRSNSMQNRLVTEWSANSQRNSALPAVHTNLNRPLPLRPFDRESTVIEEPGIPWWRRKDFN